MAQTENFAKDYNYHLMVRRGLTFQENVLVGPSCRRSQAPFSLPHSKLSSIPPALGHQRHLTCGTHLSPLLSHQTFGLRPNGPRGPSWVLYRLLLSWCLGHRQKTSVLASILYSAPSTTHRFAATSICCSQG